MTLPKIITLKLLPVMLILAACSEPEEDPLVGADLDGDIIFSSNRTGAWEVYIMDIAERVPEQLTDNRYTRIPAPKFSPDGSKIYFSGTIDADHQLDIIIMNRDGTGQINLTDNSPESEVLPLMSPDGRQIVYNANGITIMNSDGTNKRRLLAENLPLASAYEYSPLGDTILCLAGQSGPNHIYSVPMDGSAATNLTAGLNVTGNIFDIVFSPDGSHIGFTMDEEEIDSLFISTLFSNIFVMDSDGSNLVQLTNDQNESRNLGYSPDGEKILFTEVPFGGGGNAELMVMQNDGSNVRNITNNQVTERYGQFIDYRHIVYEVAELTTWPSTDFNIYIIDEGTGRRRQLTQDTAGDRRPDVFLRY